MDKVRKLFLSPAFLIAAQILLSVAIAAGAIFYTYANMIVYRLWKNVLIDLTFVFCCGALFALTYFEKEPEAKAWHLLFPFFVGAGIFAALFFASQAILDLFVNRTISCLVGVSVTLAFDLACVVVQDVFATKRNRRFFLWATAALAVGIYVGTILLSLLTLPHGWAFKSFSKDKHEFATATAESYAITDADRQAGKDWMAAHLAGADVAFDFSLGGVSFKEDIASWNALTVTDEPDASGDVTLVRTFTKAGVEVKMEAAYYDETATVEWTVYLTNRGSKRSAILSDLHPLEAAFPVSSPTLYFSGGSNEANDDFALYSRKLGKREYVFDTVDGRTSSLYLPFFNLSASDRGVTLGIGWSGQWTATFSGGESTKVCVGQSVLEGYLDPGETVRSPLVSLCLYEGGNALKGFNNFRADIRRGLGEDRSANMLMFAGAEGQDDTSRANAAGTKAYIEALASAGVLDELDYAWYDAGWYDTSKTGDWRCSVGDWKVDPVKYPDGFGTVSAYLNGNGVKSLLWYEPERVPNTSNLYKTVSTDPARASWLIEPTNGSNDCLWNMGDPAALEFMIDYISSSLIENGVSYYRQDFNIDPKRYWESADETLYEGRTGFAENKYVTGEYAFLDALRERIPGLLIDNCASGGRRIDLEMCRRAIPLWRSDYQCKKEKADLSEAAQYQLYGLSLWLPYSSISNPNAADEYDFRSLLGGCVMCYGDVLYDSTEEYVKFVRDYAKVKGYFAENYYPLTPCTSLEKVVAMQFGTEKEGVILLYSRAGQKGEKQLVMSGLSANENYRVRTIEGDSIAAGSGETLMKSGFALDLKERTAYIILYGEE